MSDECWIAGGRPTVRDYVRYKWEGQHWLAHRLAWTMAEGPIPDGMDVLHHCDTPPCVLIEHLFLGTPGDNARDRAQKGRGGNQRITHCPARHAYDEANTYVYRGHRQCRACKRAWIAARRAA